MRTSLSKFIQEIMETLVSQWILYLSDFTGKCKNYQ